MNKKLGVVFGRFQIFHNGHKHLLDTALKESDKVFVFIGSSFRSRNINNPFTFEERKAMIEEVYNYDSRIRIFPLKDYLYDDWKWKESISEIIKYNLGTSINKYEITIFGHEKDHSSYYLKTFPEFNFKEVGNYKEVHSNELRKFWFEEEYHKIRKWIPEKSYQYLNGFEIECYNSFDSLVNEFFYIKKYNEFYKDLIYPPIFQTVDNLVIKNDNILLIQRGGQLGNGNWALPGGFLEVNETLLNSTKRELFEETSLELKDDFLMFSKTFDNPSRSCLGRMLTNCYVWQIDEEKLLNAGDDASKVFWLNIKDVEKNSNMFFDDHFSIIFNILNLI